MSIVKKEINGMMMHLNLSDGGISLPLHNDGIREARWKRRYSLRY